MVVKSIKTSFISSFRVWWVGVLVLAPVLFAESWFRLQLFGMDAILDAGAYSAAGSRDHGLTSEHPDPDIAWVLKPNLDTLFKGAHFRTNSRGFRSPEFAVGGYLDPQLFGEQMRQLQFSGVSPFLS